MNPDRRNARGAVPAAPAPVPPAFGTGSARPSRRGINNPPALLPNPDGGPPQHASRGDISTSPKPRTFLFRFDKIITGGTWLNCYRKVPLGRVYDFPRDASGSLTGATHPLCRWSDARGGRTSDSDPFGCYRDHGVGRRGAALAPAERSSFNILKHAAAVQLTEGDMPTGAGAEPSAGSER